MARNGSGTYNLIAGNPVSSGAVIQSTWANNTLSDIASALTQSVSKDGQTAMTGPLPMGGQDIQNAAAITASGTVTGGVFVPTSSTLPSNGLYLPSANTIGWSANSTQIGTGTSTALVWTVPLTAKSVTVTDSTVPANGLYLSAANTVAIATNTILRGTINASGALSLLAPSSGNHQIAITAGTNGLLLNDGTSDCRYYTDGSHLGYFGMGTAHQLTIITNGAARAVIGAGGGWTFSAPTTTTLPAAVFNGAASTAPSTVTFAATGGSINCALSNTFDLTMTANVTGAYTLSNMSNTQTINVFITQDGTGSRTMVWPGSFKWPSGGAGVLSTAANAVDCLVATYRSATGFWYATLQKDFR